MPGSGRTHSLREEVQDCVSLVQLGMQSRTRWQSRRRSRLPKKACRTQRKSTAAPAANASNKPSAASKAEADPATALEGLLREQWAGTLRVAATDVKRGGDLGEVDRQLTRLADALDATARVVAA